MSLKSEGEAASEKLRFFAEVTRDGATNKICPHDLEAIAGMIGSQQDLIEILNRRIIRDDEDSIRMNKYAGIQAKRIIDLEDRIAELEKENRKLSTTRDEQEDELVGLAARIKELEYKFKAYIKAAIK